jgi:hypothetical protein
VPKLYPCLPALAAALSVLVDADSALACGELPCAQVTDIQPPDGSVGVPLNTELRVLYFGSLSSYEPTCDLDLRPIRLLPNTGDPIYLTGTVLPRPVAAEAWVIAKHVEPLAANTAYAVQLLIGDGQNSCRCDTLEWTTVSSFTSGAAGDHQPPTFAGVESLEYGERNQGSTTCGDSDLIEVFPELTPVIDAAPAPRYNIYVDGQSSKRYVEELDFGRYGEIFVDCGSSSLTQRTAVTPGASIEVRAVDLAGNESAPNTPLTIDVTCEVVPVDLPIGNPVGSAGTTGSVPSPVDTPAPLTPTVPAEPSSGCGLSRTSAVARDAASGAGAAALAGVLLLLFGGRVAGRRRASRSPQ